MSGFSGYGIQFIRYAGKIECGRDSGTLRSRCRAFFEFAERTGFDCRCGVVAGTDYRSRGASDAFGDGSARRGLRGGKLYAQNAFETAGASLHAARPEPPDARPGRRTRFGLFGRPGHGGATGCPRGRSGRMPVRYRAVGSRAASFARGRGVADRVRPVVPEPASGRLPDDFRPGRAANGGTFPPIFGSVTAIT